MSANQRLLDWLDDLCVRFIVNLPHEELQSVERICFQIEEAQWFYEDFIRPLDPSLPSMNLRIFAQRMFQHCPLFAGFTEAHHASAYEQFLQYKTRVPVRGAIMLNEEMTHAVLVKGWKKGSKWSFPRGKINKDESDLDCAVREVYEETGYDLQGAGLVKPEDEMKSISVNMREQNLQLYVFRGVPMNTYFEPRTRKEISKIDWYKLGDLPTLKRKNQVQHSIGPDLIRDNSFYMVTPFVNPLKGWIKHQKRLDKQKGQAGMHLAPQMHTGVTDTELEADIGETTADEAPLPGEDGNFAELVANLGRSHRASDALPEVSTQSPGQPIDPAEELKRLLSVGAGLPSQAYPIEAPQTTQVNPLVAMLQANSRPPTHPASVPRTPFEQLLPSPQQPQSPHGHHHPRPLQFEPMLPPPPFPYHHSQGPPYPGHHHPHIPPQLHNGHPVQISPHFLSHPPRHPDPNYPMHAPNIQQAFSQQPPRPYQQQESLQYPQQSHSIGLHGPAGPPASRLPPPKLTAHTLGLLNSFKMNEKPAISSPQDSRPPVESSQATPKVQQRPTTFRPFSFDSFAPTSPVFQSPTPVDNFQPAQPKPRSAHHDSLLSLFRSPSTAAATPAPQITPDQPVELSAFPTTPGYTRTQAAPEAGPPIPDMTAKPNLMDAFAKKRNKPGETSATVRGPVNAPDFDTMKRHAQHPLNGHSRGPSPAHLKPEQKVFIPQQILKRESTPSAVKGPSSVKGPVSMQSPTIRTTASPSRSPRAKAPPTDFKPRILKRPQQPNATVPTAASTAHTQGLLGLFKSQTPPQASPLAGLAPAPAAPVQHPGVSQQTTFDRRDALPTNQKSTLLSLFGRSSPVPGPPNQPSISPIAPSFAPKSPLAGAPIPPTRSPQPPTPKNTMSDIISPVSPLPIGSQTGSPANLASRSRISSIGDYVSPSIVIPQGMAPTSHPAQAMHQRNGFGVADMGGISTEDGYGSERSNGLPDIGVGMDKGKAKLQLAGNANGDGKSPVDKTFLLGFLNDFAKKGR